MNLKLTCLAAAAALAFAVPPQAASAAVNYASSDQGASFVSGSSVVPQGAFGLTMNYAVMEANLLTDTPGAAISNGDPRYIFGGDDPDANIVIDLGHLRLIDTIGAIADLPSMGDRPISTPFSAEVSTDGVHFTAFGAPLAIDGASLNPITITASAQSVEFIRYHFGPSATFYGAGGSSVSRLIAEGPAGVPEPAAWALMIGGFGLAGAQVRRRRATAIG